MRPEPFVAEQDKADRKGDHPLLILWIAVSGLWTAATSVRITTTWVPFAGWQKVLEGPWIWISFTVPPLMFAVVLAAIDQISKHRR